MLKSLTDWIDDRTGYRSLLAWARDFPAPGGVGWRHALGPAFAIVFVLEAITGLLLMVAYSPSSSTAWGSVFHIEHALWMGWFIRGVHYFAGQAMVILIGLVLLQMVVTGAYRQPREFRWWLGLGLLFLTIALSRTGHLLPWDQEGYWSTKIETNIVAGIPVVGPYLQRLIVGGDDYGNATITRFHAAHVVVLPTLLGVCLAATIVLVRRRRTVTDEIARTEAFWPEQALKNLVVAVVVVVGSIIASLALGGAGLDAPADPSSGEFPARPDWYFIWLFHLLRTLPSDLRLVATLVVPGAIVSLLFLLPLLDRLLPKKLAHGLACAVVLAILGGVGYLTYGSLRADAADAHFREALAEADQTSDRATALAADLETGVPPEGSTYLLRQDPLWRGRGVLERKCLGCHVAEGKGKGEQTASDLAQFGSREWIGGLLENPSSKRYFGATAGAGGMAEWKRASKLKPEELSLVADFVATFAVVPDDVTPDDWLSTKEIADHPGLPLFQKECGTCHVVDGLSEGGTRDAPELFGWGSPRWISRMVRKPGAADRYGFLEPKHQMPAFPAEQLTRGDLDMVIRYLRGDYFKTAPAAKAH